MGRALAVGALLMVVGCRVDPCDAFGAKSCLALRVHGAVGSVDQIEVEALEGFTLRDSTPPTAGAPFTLPAVFPVAVEGFAGEFRLVLRALLAGNQVGFGSASGRLTRGEHRQIDVPLMAGCPAGSKPAAGRCVEWEPESSGVTARLGGVWGSAADDVYVITDDGHVLRSTGDGVWNEFAAFRATAPLIAIGGTGPSDILVNQSSTIHRWDGSAWIDTFVGTPQFTFSSNEPGSDFFSAGYGAVYRRDGPDEWTLKNGFGGWFSVYGVRAFFSVAFAAGDFTGNGMVFESQDRGESWSLAADGFEGLTGLWGKDIDDLWACGYQGTIVRHSNVWRVEPSGVTVKLDGITGNDSGVFTVGEAGTILFSTRDGRWTRQESGTTVELTAVWAAGAEVWAVGVGGTILRKVR